MPVTLERNDVSWLIRLEGLVTVNSASALKGLLVEWFPSGKNLELDLERAEEIDLTILQLLWAAARDGQTKGVSMVARASGAARAAAQDAGFAQLPGFPIAV
ncbi:MAG TPA: STAS domain-containing protein [Bryobacteraceae bacterium]|nr:STAS domain-containing protein [Bryobacteraceae bacterium]